MKNLFGSALFLGALTLSLVSFSTKTSKSFIKGNSDGLEKIPESLFIPDAFFSKYNLELAPQSNAHIKDWSTIDRTAKIGVVDDVRWEFKDAEEAMTWHKKKLSENSENGVEFKDKMYIPGAQELHMYRESKSITDMNASMNIDTKQFYFIYVIDKVVSKVVVTVNGKVSLDDASVFPKEAAKNVRNALGIVVAPPAKPVVVAKPKPVIVPVNKNGVTPSAAKK